jgi:hypothetical protein
VFVIVDMATVFGGIDGLVGGVRESIGSDLNNVIGDWVLANDR